MITIYQTNNGKLIEKDNMEPGCWLNLETYGESDLQEVASLTQIDESLLKKLLDNHETARVEQREGTVLIVLKTPIKKGNGYRTVPLGIVINNDYIVTICKNSKTLLEPLKEENKLTTNEKTNFTIQLFYRIATQYLTYLEEIQKDLDKKETALYHATSNDALKGLMQIEKSLVYFMQAISSNEMVLERIIKGDVLPLYKSDNLLLEDAVIENKQAIAMTNLYQALLSSLTDSYGTIISNNLNQIMKFLAGATIVISIPTLVASFIGMNVDLGIIADNPFSFIYLIIFSFALSCLVAFYLKRKNML